jgi:hypothetical protein
MFNWEGVLSEETNDAYHRRPEFSSSDIKYMLDSPMHFDRMVNKKDSVKRSANDVLDLGLCSHECFLLKDTSQFVAIPAGIDRRTKDGKAAYEDFLKSNEGKRIVSRDMYENVMSMYEVISRNAQACSFLEGSTMERGALYQDNKTGLKCKFRPDIINLDRGFIADYKTAASAAPHEFSKAVARYNYHLSAAHYLEGAQRLWPQKIKDYYFIVQEKTEPYAVAIYKMDAADIFRSFELRDQVMKKIQKCIVDNHWPDWSEKILQLSIPGYGFSFSEGL